MLEFLGINLSYEMITALLILLVDVVIFFITLFKKNKKIMSVYAEIDTALPFLINKAEERYPIGYGEIKKALVLETLKQVLNDSFKNIKFEKYKKYAEDHLEYLLTLPKKGESDEEKKS